MKNTAKYVHTNLVAADWRELAKFYIKVFGCKRKPPERKLKGGWLDSLTSIRNARIEGIHLALPGYGKDGPTLEVFQYSKQKRRKAPSVSHPGFGHIAFAVKDVKAALAQVKRHGGSAVGSLISTTIRGVGPIEVVYARDPEGNQAVEKTDACGPKEAHRDRSVSQVYDGRVSSLPVLLTVSFLFSLSCGPVGGFAIRHNFKPALSPFS
jgi:lactoylglutathione lyase